MNVFRNALFMPEVLLPTATSSFSRVQAMSRLPAS
jgi:hypothetical protein